MGGSHPQSKCLLALLLALGLQTPVCLHLPPGLGAQLCLTLCNSMDCSPPGSSVHGDSPGKNTGVYRAALLQGIFPTQGSNPSLVSCMGRWFFTTSATWEAALVFSFPHITSFLL